MNKFTERLRRCFSSTSNSNKIIRDLLDALIGMYNRCHWSIFSHSDFTDIMLGNDVNRTWGRMISNSGRTVVFVENGSRGSAYDLDEAIRMITDNDKYNLHISWVDSARSLPIYRIPGSITIYSIIKKVFSIPDKTSTALSINLGEDRLIKFTKLINNIKSNDDFLKTFTVDKRELLTPRELNTFKSYVESIELVPNLMLEKDKIIENLNDHSFGWVVDNILKCAIKNRINDSNIRAINKVADHNWINDFYVSDRYTYLTRFSYKGSTFRTNSRYRLAVKLNYDNFKELFDNYKSDDLLSLLESLSDKETTINFTLSALYIDSYYDGAPSSWHEVDLNKNINKICESYYLKDTGYEIKDIKL